ncbi:VIER F-box protein 2 [Tanacetum coccineum]
MDNDLFTYEVEVADIPCNSKMNNDSEDETDDDMGYDPSDHYGFTGSEELTDEESSDNEDENDEVFIMDTNIFDYETPIYSAFNEFNYLLKKPWTDTGVWTEPKLVIHTCKPFNYKTGCSEWPTCNRIIDGYCNGGNLPGTSVIGNQLHYQDYEWYEALEDSELKDLALQNKASIEGFINKDDKEFEMIKYSFGQDEEYVAIKEDEYDDLARTSNDACRAYQKIFPIMDEGWMDPVKEISTNIDSYSEDQYSVSIKKIRRIRACTHHRPQRNKDQYAISKGLNTPYLRYGINIIFWKISNVVPTPRNPQYAVSNTWIRQACQAAYEASKPKIQQTSVERDRYDAHDRLVDAYFFEHPRYDEPKLRQRVVPDALDEYLQMGTTTACESLRMFCKVIMNLYGEEFLRKPTYTDMEKFYARHDEKHGFPVMLGSIDCTGWPWENCPVAYRAQFCRGDHGPDPFILLEAIASQDL